MAELWRFTPNQSFLAKKFGRFWALLGLKMVFRKDMMIFWKIIYPPMMITACGIRYGKEESHCGAVISSVGELGLAWAWSPFLMPYLDFSARLSSHLLQFIHTATYFRVASSKSGKIYLHTDVRMIIFRKSDLDTATDHENGKGWELR